MLEYISKALEAAGFCEPCRAVELDGISEKRLPMNRLERKTHVRVKVWPRPLTEVLSFHAEESGEVVYPLFELSRLLELIETPDGLIRGHGIESSVRDGAAVVSVTYTELLTMAETRKPSMSRVKLTQKIKRS